MKDDGLTVQVLAEAGPTVVGTLLKHYLTSRKSREDSEKHDTARVEFMYDEAFNVAKVSVKLNKLTPDVLECLNSVRWYVSHLTRSHTADALQKFGQTRTPSPPWVAIHRLSIPQVTSSLAAKYLIEALGGKEMAFKIAGGTTWWQVRAGRGVECEWITMKKDVRHSDRDEARWEKQQDQQNSKNVTTTNETAGGEAQGREPVDPPAEALDDDDTGFIPEMDRMRCMLYVHGGGYYWGSINTHRYIIWRFARKINGRAFAVNYRKAPQYPFPCAIQDVLSAYLYLVNPPAGAPHRPVDPKNIIVAGDSAGGGLVFSLLQILRDTPGLELPAGAVLISPWSDLTHSFPSILKNTKTDMLPPYSFIHKPSSLWPPPPPELSDAVKARLMSRVRRGLHKLKDTDHPAIGSEAYPSLIPEPRTSSDKVVHTSDPEAFMKLKDIFNPGKDAEREPVASAAHMSQATANPAEIFENLTEYNTTAGQDQATTASLASCDDSLIINARGMTVVCDTQIQLYARNSQLCHPYVSPVLGYLGGLPPLYIMAGNSEVLRDEIIYAAHKAAHPEQHPIRDDVRKLMPSLEGIEKRYGPTDVHLQVYDGVGHDLPLLSMTKPSRGVFRAIASFCLQVTPQNRGLDSVGTSTVDTPEATSIVDTPQARTPAIAPRNRVMAEGDTEQLDRRLEELKLEGIDLENDGENEVTESPTSVGSASSVPAEQAPTPAHKPHRQSTLSSFFRRTNTATPPTPARAGTSDTTKGKAGPGEAGWPGIYSGDAYTNHMIRERVNFDGVCRPLEPESELGAMVMPSDEIGMIKEGPALRYIEGQAIWDKRFRHTRKRIARHRKKNLAKAHDRDAKTLRDRWSKVVTDVPESDVSSDEDPLTWCDRNAEHLPADSSWAWQWALGGEQPPPSAIVGRRDLPEGRKTALQADRVDTTDDSELHALSIWVMLAQMFSSRSENQRASEAWRSARETHRVKKKHHRLSSLFSK